MAAFRSSLNSYDEKKDDEAVKSIFCGELSQYGTIVLFTHGGFMEDNDSICNSTYTIYRCKNKDSEKTIEEIESKLYEYAKLEYESKYGVAPKKKQLDQFYGNYYGKVGDKSSWRIYNCWEKQKKKYVGEVQISSRYFMDRYESTGFDNTVFYIGACEGLIYAYFDQWLVNHGCKLVIGYNVEISTLTVLYDFEEVINQLTAVGFKESWRTKNANETPNNIMKNIIENIAVLPLKPWIENGIQDLGRLYSDNANIFYWGNPEFFYCGYGSISGKVMYKADDSDAEKAKDTPCEGATVTAYLYHNMQFVELKKVKTDSKGEFKIKGFRCGAYALVITDSEGNSKKVSIVADNKDNDGGTVYLEKRTIISQPVGEVVEYKDALYYWKRGGKSQEYYATKLIQLKDGKEKVLFDCDTVTAKDEWGYVYYGDGNIAIANNRVFFEVDCIDGNILYSVKLDGSDVKRYHYYTCGNIIGLSLDNEYLIIDPYGQAEDEEQVYTFVKVNTKTHKVSLVKSSSYTKWMHDGYVYYINYKESKHIIELYKSTSDGSEKIKLGTFKTPNYGQYNYPSIAQVVYPVIDGSEYVYFSYGCFEGTSTMFGNGRLARAKLDGSEYEIIKNVDFGGYFSVNEDGSVKGNDSFIAMQKNEKTVDRGGTIEA